MHECCEYVYDCLQNVLLVNVNVNKVHVNRGSQNACCSDSKVEIISLAFKWLIILRSALKKNAQ